MGPRRTACPSTAQAMPGSSAQRATSPGDGRDVWLKGAATRTLPCKTHRQEDRKTIEGRLTLTGFKLQTKGNKHIVWLVLHKKLLYR